MIGMLQWNPKESWLHPVRLAETSVLHTRFLCAQMREGSAARRVHAAGRKLLRRGVQRVVLPENVPPELLPEGLRPVSTLPLRRVLAADWVSWLLQLREEPGSGARVLVTADGLSAAAVRTVTELALRCRYLLLAVPFGGEELCRRLRREYGVSVLLNPGEEQAECAVHVAFDPTESRGRSFLPLYDETLPLPPLLLPPEMEARLPAGMNRGALISVLLEQGALRPGEVNLGR